MDVQVLLVMSSPLNSQMTSVLLGLLWVPEFAQLTYGVGFRTEASQQRVEMAAFKC